LQKAWVAWKELIGSKISLARGFMRLAKERQ